MEISDIKETDKTKNIKEKMKNVQLLHLKTRIKLGKPIHYYNNNLINLVANLWHQQIKSPKKQNKMKSKEGPKIKKLHQANRKISH